MLSSKIKHLPFLKASLFVFSTATFSQEITQPVVSSEQINIISVEDLQFRDLNKNGQLDKYEDWRLSPEKRTKDLLKRMTIDEKIGQLAHSRISPGPNGYNFELLQASVLEQGITSYIPRASMPTSEFAKKNNQAQQIAEQSRLGIPLTISTDPRHHFQSTAGASTSGEGFSVWPETLGFAAINDPELTQRFAQTVAAEYRATGFNLALSPQADLVSEPRWPRSYGTFGADPYVAKTMVGAYVSGIQGSTNGLQAGFVPAIVKHWVGYGAATDGFDSHNYYGRNGDLKSENLHLHIEPFTDAFKYQVAGVMPAYSIFPGLRVNGEEVEQTGAAYSKKLIKELLVKKQKYTGFVLSDWAILNDCTESCKNGAPAGEKPGFDSISTAWGVSELSQAERVALAMHAGVHQFGGLSTVKPIIEAYGQKLISKKLIDKAAAKVLVNTFKSGVFEAPFVDEDAVSNLVNAPKTQELALQTQAKAITVLKRGDDGQLLPKGKHKLFLHNAGPDAFTNAGHQIVENIDDADVAIVRLAAPYETLHPGYFFGSKHHEGSLAFKEDSETIRLLKSLQGRARVIVDISLDRPAILTNILPLTNVLVANFGASDSALLSALDGTIEPVGKLPFELPSSMAAVEVQDSGKPADSEKPLFPIHYSAPKEAQQSTMSPPPPPLPISPIEHAFIPLRNTGLGNEQWEHFFNQTTVRNVDHPALYPVLPAPEKNNGQAVIIVPGGGYQFVSIENEGLRVAEKLAEQGYNAFILKYRTHKTPEEPAEALVAIGKLFSTLGKSVLPDHIPAVDDLELAIKYIQNNAERWNIDDKQAHVIGFSAGARTTIRYLERDVKESSLASAALIYPPMKNIIGAGARPPLFMAVAVDDPLFIQGGMTMAENWWRETGKIEFHLYSGGSHGFGMTETGTTSEDWINQYLLWLRSPK